MQRIVGGEAGTYQGLLILHQANDFHGFLFKILIDIIGEGGQDGVKILLGDSVVYHEHSLPEKPEGRAGSVLSQSQRPLAGQG